jgi:hypothetical protein
MKKSRCPRQDVRGWRKIVQEGRRVKSRVLPKTTTLRINLVYSAHIIPFCAYNEPLKGFVDGISGSVCPLKFYVF